MARQDRSKVTREAIINGAAEIFESHGYGLTTLNQVADASRVTKGALYFHFQSKEELAIAVIEEQHSRVLADMNNILAQNGPAFEAIILICRAFGRGLMQDVVVRAGIRLTFEAATFDQPIRKPYKDWIDIMKKLVIQSQKEEQVRRSLEPDGLARYIVASFTGVQMVSGVLTERQDIMERIADMWVILIPGLIHEELREKPAKVAHLVSLATLDYNEPKASVVTT